MTTKLDKIIEKYGYTGLSLMIGRYAEMQAKESDRVYLHGVADELTLALAEYAEEH